MKDVLQEITRLRTKRDWTEYELAKRAGITQSTISTWYRKNQVPTVPSLDKICQGFDITLSQFFGEEGDSITLTEPQRELLDHWAALTPRQRQVVRDLMECMAQRDSED
ncbi:MAG: helix-turn-helix transcriptional regulator [Eubacteriales bacterium]|nr:helix-turn-helix transcriptional regulator [Eubacteriales bacterium]